MLLTDSPVLAHLPEDQAFSVESFSAPTQFKIVAAIFHALSKHVL